MLRGTSRFVIAIGLCGSACNIYHGDRIPNQEQREQATTRLEPVPRKLRDLEEERFRSPSITIFPRLDASAAASADAKAAEPPSAGAQAPAADAAGATDPADEEDAGAGDSVTPNEPDADTPLDAGAASDLLDASVPDAEAGTPLDQAASSEPDAGSPLDQAASSEPDAGSPLDRAQLTDAGRPQMIETGRPDKRPVARESAACRGQRGYESDGRCYFVVTTKVSWNVGRDRCYERGAHLASITSERESELIASFELEQDVWIGFSRFGAAYFSWLTNESTSFSNWQKGAPRAMQESGALIKASTGLWTNRAVSELHAALCEFEPRH